MLEALPHLSMAEDSVAKSEIDEIFQDSVINSIQLCLTMLLEAVCSLSPSILLARDL